MSSRNCSQTRRRCRYPVTDSVERSTSFPGFTWPSAADRSIEKWRDSGQPPFPFLELPMTPSWHNLSLGKLRHMHHLALMASMLELSKTRQFCLWWSEITMCVRASALHSKASTGINPCISSFFQLAIRFDFVAYAVMGHSAGRLALVTKISSAFEDATRYRTLALQGLNSAITSFTKDNADAILCASLCLSNQEHDWLVHSEHLVESYG